MQLKTCPYMAQGKTCTHKTNMYKTYKNWQKRGKCPFSKNVTKCPVYKRKYLGETDIENE